MRAISTTFPSDSGFLGVLDTPDLPFTPKRLYWIHSVPALETRGNHAHKQLNQFFIALKGEVQIEISSIHEKIDVKLSDPNKFLVLKAGFWRKLYNFTSDAVILVGADAEYKSEDYIHKWNEYLIWSGENNV